MSKANFTAEFKLDAIKQITERGYSVADVSRRLGVSTDSLYSWMKRDSAPPKSSSAGRSIVRDQACETRACSCHREARHFKKAMMETMFKTIKSEMI